MLYSISIQNILLPHYGRARPAKDYFSSSINIKNMNQARPGELMTKQTPTVSDYLLKFNCFDNNKLQNQKEKV